MFRRAFIQQLTLGVTTSIAAVRAAEAIENKTAVTYKISGFSCPTCAVGLEVMLRQQDGIVLAKASYGDANVSIAYDPSLINEQAIRTFIASTGFTIEE